MLALWMLCLGLSSIAYGDAQESSLSDIRQQLSYFQKLNLQDRLEVLQSNVASLRGQVDELQHDLKKANAKINLIEKAKKSAGAKGKQRVVGNLSTKDAYQAALKLLRKKDYDGASQAFSSFIQQYPKSKLVVNAHYWMGEIYLLYSHYAKATKEFKWVVTMHPKHVKAPDAMFKWGVSEMDSGHAHKASEVFQRLISDYPQSTSAHLAKVHMSKFSEKKSS
ncbi:MAG TPA: tol-pal system protein YbgF [Gammaproteobacteria bacterium]|nr:tol-pal system protein YbgF [Gammaproteobacteria bacterium]